MRYLFIAIFLLTMSSCTSSTSVIESKMIVTPMQISFEKQDSLKRLSITHTCTCPFNWNPTPDADWILVQPGGSMDNDTVPVRLDRAKLAYDTTTGTITITSNGYGTATVTVTAIR